MVEMIFNDFYSNNSQQWQTDLADILHLFQSGRTLNAYQVLQTIPRLNSGRINRALQYLVMEHKLEQEIYARKRDKALRFNYRLLQ